MPRGKFDYDCAIVGGGPAGLVSALYLARFERSTLLFDAGTPRAAWIPRTHNLLGYRGGISGTELLTRLRSQVTECKVDIKNAECTIKKIRGGFELKTESESYSAHRVIIATGVQDVQPVLPNLTKLRKRGLLRYCPICDAYEYRKKPLVVLAQDDHGLKSALFVSRFGSRVDVVISKDQKPDRKLYAQCLRAGIRFHRGALLSIETKPENEGLWVHIENSAPIYGRVCYVALGSVVNDSAFRTLQGLNRSEDGRLKVSSSQETGVPGLYAVGDCVEALAQIAVAAGGAAIAATQVHNGLREEFED